MVEAAGDPWDEVVEQLRKTTVGEFVISRELGRGGMAAVFLAHEIALNRKVAIKVMAPGLLLGKGMVERFRQEAVTVANLSHPNIVTIHGVRQAGGLHFFVMKLIPGRSLDRIIHDAGPLPIPIVQAILFQVGSALSYAHRRGVIHRDIKPSNVLMDDEGNAIVTDFGIAKVVTTQSQTMTGATVGTPAYMSPEQCWSKEVTGASDQYALGIVAYEMLTGQPPFTGPTLSILRAQTEDIPRPLREARRECPKPVEAAVLRMLEKDPAKRWPTVVQAIEALGGRALGDSDPLREQLTALGQRGPEEPSLESSFTPRSPIPPRQPTPPPAAPVVPASPVDATVLPSAVLLVAPSSTMRQGAAMQISASVRGSDGTRMPEPIVEWLSSDPRIATVSGSGVIRALSPGTATVSARAASGPIGRLAIQVLPPGVANVSIVGLREVMSVGDRLSLRVELRDSDGRPLTDRQVTWNSNMPHVAKVGSTGGLIAVGAGSATITALVDGVSGAASVTVRRAGVPDSGPASSPGGLGRRIPVAVTGSGTPAIRRPLSPRWLAAGAILGIGLIGWLVWPRPGNDVIPETPVAVRVTPTTLTLGPNDSAHLQAAVTSGDGRAAKQPVAWSSSDSTVARVTSLGVVSAGKPGSATVEARVGVARSAAAVTVTGPQTLEVSTVEVTPPRVQITAGRSLRLRARAQDEAGTPITGQRTEWSSSDPDVARVSASGVLTAVSPGTATITATVDEVPSEAVPVSVAPAPAGGPAGGRPGIVRMLIAPWAFVLVDGSAKGQRVRGEDTLRSGVPHRLRFERTGYASIDTTVTLQPGEARLLRIQMTPRKP
jgi:serine/threonine-protein kinase